MNKNTDRVQIGDHCQYREYDAEVVEFDGNTVSIQLLDEEAEGEILTIDYIPSHWT